MRSCEIDLTQTDRTEIQAIWTRLLETIFDRTTSVSVVADLQLFWTQAPENAKQASERLARRNGQPASNLRLRDLSTDDVADLALCGPFVISIEVRTADDEPLLGIFDASSEVYFWSTGGEALFQALLDTLPTAVAQRVQIENYD